MDIIYPDVIMSAMQFTWDDLIGRLPGCHLARFTHHAGSGVSLHNHDFAELFWVERGVVLHQTERQQCRVKPGHGMLVAPSVRHALRAGTASTTIVNLAVPGPTWQRWEHTYGDMADWPWPSAEPTSLRMPADITTRLEHFLAGPGDVLAVDAFVLPLLRDLRPDPLINQMGDAPSWLVNAIHIAAQPAGLAAGMHAIVEASGRSREHCARSIRKHLGCRPNDLVRQLRLDWLATQLRLGNTAFASLCHQLNLVNITHMHKHFIQRFGLTPGEYRRRCRGIA